MLILRMSHARQGPPRPGPTFQVPAVTLFPGGQPVEEDLCAQVVVWVFVGRGVVQVFHRPGLGLLQLKQVGVGACVREGGMRTVWPAVPDERTGADRHCGPTPARGNPQGRKPASSLGVGLGPLQPRWPDSRRAPRASGLCRTHARTPTHAQPVSLPRSERTFGYTDKIATLPSQRRPDADVRVLASLQPDSTQRERAPQRLLVLPGLR